MLPNNSKIARLEHGEIVFIEGLTAADDARPRLQQRDHPQKLVASVTGPSGELKNYVLVVDLFMIFYFPGDYTLWSTLTQHKCFAHSHPGPL